MSSSEKKKKQLNQIHAAVDNINDGWDTHVDINSTAFDKFTAFFFISAPSLFGSIPMRSEDKTLRCYMKFLFWFTEADFFVVDETKRRHSIILLSTMEFNGSDCEKKIVESKIIKVTTGSCD